MLKKAASILPILLTIIFAIVVIITFISRQIEPPSQAPENMYDFYVVDGKMNINTVNAYMLYTNLGLDEKICLRIIAHREENGPYRDIHELLNIRGITEEVFAEISPNITVGDVK